MIDKELIEKAEEFITSNIPSICLGNNKQEIVPYTFTTIYDLLLKVKIYLTLKSEGRTIWCQSYKNRSIGDLFSLAKYYGFKGSLYDFYILFYSEIHDDRRIASFICSDIDKRVYFIDDDNNEDDDQNGNYFNSYLEDEFRTDLTELVGNLTKYDGGYGGGNSIESYLI